MNISNKQESLILFLGDVSFFVAALWLSLLLRNLAIPGWSLFLVHIVPFSLLFSAWVLTFFIAGLYEKHTLIVRRRLPYVILNAQTANSIIAIIFFYFIPYFLITPKTVLFIDLVISFAFIMLWRTVGKDLFLLKKKQQAILIGSGKEVDALAYEINNNPRYGLSLEVVPVFDAAAAAESIESDGASKVDVVGKRIRRLVEEKGVRTIIADLEDDSIAPLLPSLYNLVFSNVLFLDVHEVYEEVFDRIPFSLLKYNWFLENVSMSPKFVYDFFKRTVDIVVAVIGGSISLVFYPFVYLAIKLEDGGPMFIFQERIGRGGRLIRLVKFRSMKSNDRGAWLVEGDARITKAGKWLRKSRIDELPQFWNVLRGDVSLIGPRPDLQDLGIKLAEAIPYHAVRTLIKPGLSGWAQIKQALPPQSIEENKLRLSYDIFYIKNRSLLLDMKIILQTIKTLLSRTGL